MKARKLIIHVGAPKTGTTAIQNELFANRDYLFNVHGKLYPRAGIKIGQRGHHNLLYDINAFFRSAGKFDESRGGWLKVLQEIERLDARTVIISAEGLIRHAAKVSKALKPFRFFDIEIVMYLRRQDEYLESGYNQLARFARVEDDFESFIVRRAKIIDYRAIVEKWLQRIPSARIICTPFERSVIGDNVMMDFAKRVLDIPDFPTNAPASNPRAGLKSIQAARLVKKHVSDRLGADYAISTRVASQIRRLFTERFEDVYDFSFSNVEDSRRIVAQAEPTNRWLAQRFPGFDAEFFFSGRLDESKCKSPYREVAFTADEVRELEVIIEQAAAAARPASAPPQADQPAL